MKHEAIYIGEGAESPTPVHGDQLIPVDWKFDNALEVADCCGSDLGCTFFSMRKSLI